MIIVVTRYTFSRWAVLTEGDLGAQIRPDRIEWLLRDREVRPDPPGLAVVQPAQRPLALSLNQIGTVGLEAAGRPAAREGGRRQMKHRTRALGTDVG